MQTKANFLKRIDNTSKRSKSHEVSLQHLASKATKHVQEESSQYSLKRSDISGFIVIGILNRKVIVSFSNALRLFGYFDLHAVHERIRYEYYSWKIRSQELVTSEICSIDESVVEKGGKALHSVYGQVKKCLIKVKNTQVPLALLGPKSKCTFWGVTIQQNQTKQVFITSFLPIYGRQFTPSELESIVSQVRSKGRVPCIIDEWIGEFSCKSAYKFNCQLGMENAKLLIVNLGRCSFPWHCVHGRTTIHVKPWPLQ